MSNIVIYTTQTCPYCIRAKELLSSLNISFEEIRVDGDHDARKALAIKAKGSKTVPQIFINDTHIGGCDDLYMLHRTGKLS